MIWDASSWSPLEIECLQLDRFDNTLYHIIFDWKVWLTLKRYSSYGDRNKPYHPQRSHVLLMRPTCRKWTVVFWIAVIEYLGFITFRAFQFTEMNFLVCSSWSPCFDVLFFLFLYWASIKFIICTDLGKRKACASENWKCDACTEKDINGMGAFLFS